jgi:micrococcal nuclease
MIKMPWVFNKAELVRVVDGDTVKLRVDMGFRITFKDNFRLARINAPEKKGETKQAGLDAKEQLIRLIVDGGISRITTQKHGKYRWVIELYNDQGESINNLMVEANHAKFVDY